MYTRQSDKTSNSNWSSGLLYGCFAFFCFMILLTILTHRISLYTRESDDEDLNIAEIVSKKNRKELSAAEKTLIQKKKKYQKIILALGITVPFMVAIPVLIADGSEEANAGAVTIIVGFLFSTFIILILLDLKSYFKKYGKSIISYVLG